MSNHKVEAFNISLVKTVEQRHSGKLFLKSLNYENTEYHTAKLACDTHPHLLQYLGFAVVFTGTLGTPVCIAPISRISPPNNIEHDKYA